MNHANHLRYLFDVTRRNITIDLVLKEVEEKKYEFDAIAVRGTSGLLVGSIVAHLLGKEICIVRKNNEGSHSLFNVEGPEGIEPKFLIIDDCVDSGETIVHILAAIKASSEGAKCVGAIMYNRLVDKEFWLGQRTYSPDELAALVKRFRDDFPDRYKDILFSYTRS